MTPLLASGRILIVIFSSNGLLAMVWWAMYEDPVNRGVVRSTAGERGGEKRHVLRGLRATKCTEQVQGEIKRDAQ